MATLWARLSGFCSFVGMYMIFCMMFLISGEVLFRYFLGRSIPGTIEVTQFLQVVAVGLGVSYTQRRGANISDDFFVDMLPNRWQIVIRGFHYLVAAVICGIMAYAIFKLSSTRGAMREYTDTLRIPLYPFRFLLAGGFALLAIQLIIDAFHPARPHTDAAIQEVR
ncbi:putative TRAP transporter small permease [Hyphomicrobiales bacterium]|nr:putative TRAP transporter small permease [Hyphomicrobiales bacterium]CAH1695360.1 putative TRAP transporter small permease [Hyphomicrobiales bacterium]